MPVQLGKPNTVIPAEINERNERKIPSETYGWATNKGVGRFDEKDLQIHHCLVSDQLKW